MKLIRDQTPDLARGSTRLVRDEVEHEILLRMKLMEEAGEVAASTSREELVKELGDLEEVIIVLMNKMNITQTEVEIARLEKWNRKGGFDGGVVLIHDPLSNKTSATI